MNNFELPELSAEQRKVFSQRLLTLHKVLAESADENYVHSWIINHHADTVRSVHPANTCGTAACALGHAVWHYEHFPGLPVECNSHGVAHGLKVEGHRGEGEISVANKYFGPRAWHYIFDVGAYVNEHGHRGVTRAMAMRRIEDYIQHGLGCRLLEDPSPE